jgi:hypothetical protein
MLHPFTRRSKSPGSTEAAQTEASAPKRKRRTLNDFWQILDENLAILD